MRSFPHLMVFLTIPLTACVAVTDTSDTCGASGYQGLIGQPGSLAEALELDQPVRIIPDGSAVTMDFLERRINFALGPDGRIARVSCG